MSLSKDNRLLILLRRGGIVVLCHFLIGLCIAVILWAKLGSDPCTTMNVGISNHLPISFGTWSMLFNAAMLLIVFFFDRTKLGIGTVSNMIVVGYSADFGCWLIDRFLPQGPLVDSLIFRLAICLPVLALFILIVAVYLSMDVGVAPYDAMPYIITNRIGHLSFSLVRTVWDVTALVIGVVLGADFGIVTLIMAFSLGSVISWVTGLVSRFFSHI